MPPPVAVVVVRIKRGQDVVSRFFDGMSDERLALGRIVFFIGAEFRQHRLAHGAPFESFPP